ncbi:CMP/dCMP deaminase [Tieghemostelium lacteum]|uniref:CMP/dCMP deaminase n=1 Tax=Tieghemostelium lacteum TaxID=361077 RepID=A0A151Z7T0_TIELA|nr:CMP/dCMP deaminase [Tieghemostelium lacteum]|eukprot:KYQ90026.1 CMP/dCMP deaminase [Tieghemostelium lacteum]
MKSATVLFLLLATVAFASAAKDYKAPWVEIDPSRVYRPKDLRQSERLFHEAKMQEIVNHAIAKGSVFASSVVNATSGETICINTNAVGQKKDMTQHGEMVVMMNCSSIYGLFDWTGFYLYTTGESCPMCQSAAMWNRFSKIIFGSSIKFLYCNHCQAQILIESQVINAMGYGLNDFGEYTPAQIIGGILEENTNSLFVNYCNPGPNDTNSQSAQPACLTDSDDE